MINQLDPQLRSELVNYRIEKSGLALKEAEIMAQNELFDNAVTRLYYACFYAASALLIKNKIETGSHRAVKTMLSLHFVKPGLLDTKHIRTYSELLNGRQLSDYEDFFYQDRDSYETYRQDALVFIEAIKNLIFTHES